MNVASANAIASGVTGGAAGRGGNSTAQIEMMKKANEQSKVNLQLIEGATGAAKSSSMASFTGKGQNINIRA